MALLANRAAIQILRKKKRGSSGSAGACFDTLRRRASEQHNQRIVLTCCTALATMADFCVASFCIVSRGVVTASLPALQRVAAGHGKATIVPWHLSRSCEFGEQ